LTETTFDNYGNLFNGSVMAKTVLFSGLQIPTDQSNSTKAKGTGI
jgi:hypothetical protein